MAMPPISVSTPPHILTKTFHHDETIRRISTLALGVIGSVAILATLQPPASVILASLWIIVAIVEAFPSQTEICGGRESVRERTVFVERPSFFPPPYIADPRQAPLKELQRSELTEAPRSSMRELVGNRSPENFIGFPPPPPFVDPNKMPSNREPVGRRI